MASNRNRGIDLHIHSSASDGTFDPVQILQMAADAGLQAIAITDHDTLEGAVRALSCALPQGLDFLTGVEISAQAPIQCNVGGSLHILGYGFDPYNLPLQKTLGDLQHARAMRIPKIVERLNQLGLPLTLAEVMDEVGQGMPGRPHVARILVKKGIVADIDEAFDKYLAKGRPAFVEKFRLACQQAFALIRGAGGIPVLAHPFFIRCSRPDQMSLLVRQLSELGLMGIEAYYPQHPAEAVAQYLELARQYRLAVTGGTDFHGALTPSVQIGYGRGDFHVPYALYESLRALIAQSKPL